MDDSERMEFDLERGVPSNYKFKRPAKFHFEFKNGSYVSGVISANSILTICSRGDFEDINIMSDEDSVQPLRLVDKPNSADD